MSASDAPPPVLYMARVLAYAILDDSVEWTGRQTIFVGGKELGVVPRLAICQNVGGGTEDILVFHCNDEWEVLGVGGAETLESAKASAERAYRGVGAKWVETNVSIDEAKAWIKEHYEELTCSFCGRELEEVRNLVEGKSGTHICNHCIDEFYTLIRQPPEDGSAA